MIAQVTRPRIVGIDPSLTASGVARSDGHTKVLGISGVTKMPLPQRGREICRLAARVVDESIFPGGITRELKLPRLAVIELPSVATGYGGNLERIGLFWEIVRQLQMFDVPVVAPTAPQRLKYLFGKGAGSKTAVVEAVTRTYPDFETGGDDNICDAIVYLAMGLDQYGHPLVPVSADRRKVLAEIRNPDKSSAWPEIL